MKHLYLAPHLDDVLLSCGGAIHHHTAKGEPVQVLTVFAGEAGPGANLSSFARIQHKFWGNPPRPMALRRAEDIVALTLLDAEARHLDYLDAVYRTGPDGEWLYGREDALWGEVHPGDPLGWEEGRELIQHLSGLLPPVDETVIYAPLGVGNHVDHQVVHTAGRKLLALGYRLAFYEDYPYAERPDALETALVSEGTGPWQAETLSLEASDLAAKVAALAYYRSQLPVLFGGAELMPSRVWAFAASRSRGAGLAERLWRLPDGPAGD